MKHVNDTRPDRRQPKTAVIDTLRERNTDGTSSACSEDATFEEMHGMPWQPSAIRYGPLAGLAALCLGLCQIIASFLVLMFSNGSRIEDWRVQPTVYIAVLTAISNKALSFATVQGTIVTFWLRLARGTTLGQAHRDWGYGLHVYKAIKAGRHFNTLALACICATFVAVDGPLLQRASIVRSRPPDAPITVDVSITPEILSYFTGWGGFYANRRPAWGQMLQDDFVSIAKNQISKRPITGAISGCPGECELTVRAPALALRSCESKLEFINYDAPWSSESQRYKATKGVPSYNTIFSISFNSLQGPNELVQIETEVVGQEVADTGKGNRNKTTCLFQSSIGRYNVIASNGALKLVGDTAYPEIVAVANNTALTAETVRRFNLTAPGQEGVVRSTMIGIVFWATMEMGFVQNVWRPNGTSAPTKYECEPAPTLFAFEHIANWKAFATGNVPPVYEDPWSAILHALNEMMFRTGVETAQMYSTEYLQSLTDEGLDIHYTTTAKQLNDATYFHMEFGYFVGAATIEISTILVICYTFYGWWRLGRNMTMSPLEIAKAFDAPLLANVPSNDTAGAILDAEGKIAIQYGVAYKEKRYKIVVANKEDVFKLEGA